MVDYNNIFLEKIGQSDVATPSWDSSRISSYLDTQAFLVSRNYATPWADFNSVPDNYQYPVTLYAAIQYWWGKAGEYASKFDIQVGGSTQQKSSQLFDRALRLIALLTEELENIAIDMLNEGSPEEIIVGDMVKRSKYTGYLVPRSDDPAGDWTS
jgi:hypothetical protein